MNKLVFNLGREKTLERVFSLPIPLLLSELFIDFFLAETFVCGSFFYKFKTLGARLRLRVFKRDGEKKFFTSASGSEEFSVCSLR